MDNNDVAGPAVAFDAMGAVGQQLRPVSDSLIKARLLARMPVYVVAFVAAVAAAVLHSPWWWIAAALAGVNVGWQLWLIPHQVRCIGWAEGEDDLVSCGMRQPSFLMGGFNILILIRARSIRVMVWPT